MKSRVLTLLLTALLPLGLRAQLIDLVPLQSYFVKNTVRLNKGYNCKVITRQQDFEQYAGVAKTSTNAVISPDFRQFIVLSVAKPATSIETNLSFKEASLYGTQLRVYFTETRGDALSYYMLPSATVMVARPEGLQQVCFYRGSKLIRRVRL